MGHNLAEKIRPSLVTIAKKGDEKKSAYAESRSILDIPTAFNTASCSLLFG
ncbi:MAG: hypothetical protein M3Y53_08685 [Thermoproteota archaeon]|nr:hypothetical protein [Thermoproteota archaeon]